MASTLAYGCAPEERQQYQESATGAGMKRKASGDLIQPAHGLSEQNRRGRTVVHDILDDSDEYGEKGFDELLVEYGDDLSEHAHRSVGTSFTSDVDASFKVEPGARIEVGHEEPIKTGSGISIKSEPDEPDEPDVKIKLEPLSQKKNGLLRQEEDEFDDDSLDGEFNIHGDELEDEAKTALRVKTMMEQERQGRLRDLIVYGQHSEEIKQALRENVEARKRISPPLKDYPWACTRCHEIIEWFHDIGDPHCFYHSGTLEKHTQAQLERLHIVTHWIAEINVDHSVYYEPRNYDGYRWTCCGLILKGEPCKSFPIHQFGFFVSRPRAHNPTVKDCFCKNCVLNERGLQEIRENKYAEEGQKWDDILRE